jgi:hypothetical protein
VQLWLTALRPPPGVSGQGSRKAVGAISALYFTLATGLLLSASSTGLLFCFSFKSIFLLFILKLGLPGISILSHTGWGSLTKAVTGNSKLLEEFQEAQVMVCKAPKGWSGREDTRKGGREEGKGRVKGITGQKTLLSWADHLHCAGSGRCRQMSYHVCRPGDFLPIFSIRLHAPFR